MALFQIFCVNHPQMHVNHVINYKIRNLQIVLKTLKILTLGITPSNTLLILKLLELDHTGF